MTTTSAHRLLCRGLVLGLMVGLATGYQTFQYQIPNGANVPHPCLANYMWPGVGHLNRLGAGDLNIFGEHFKLFGYQWNETICSMDSDGDGMTNGQELGDPNCMWSYGAIAERSTGLSHPGVCDPIDSPECAGKNDFVSCEEEEFDCPHKSTSSVLSFEFTDHEVPNTETNYYCMTFDLPSDQDYHIIATEPIVDNADLLHHILLYGCQDDSNVIPTPTLCGMESDERDLCNILVGLWSVGLPGVCYDGVGYRFGNTTFRRIKMEIHYNNPMEKTGQRDASGMSIYYQPVSEDVEDMVTLWTGTQAIEIPPGETNFEVVNYFRGDCMSTRILKPAKIWGAFNHMHYLGKSMRMELFRDGAKVGDITLDESYSYDSPVLHRNEYDLLPGDEIKTTCVYDTFYTDHYVRYGEATSDEMCFGFIFAYPRDAIDDNHYLISYGPLDTCELYAGVPIETSVGTCNWAAFQSFTDDHSPPWAVSVDLYCSDDGLCRDKCKDIVHGILQEEPCLHEDTYVLVNFLLAMNPKALQSLARLNTCRGVVLEEMKGGDGGDGGDGDTCTWDDCRYYCAYDAGSNMAASWPMTLSLSVLLLTMMASRQL